MNLRLVRHFVFWSPTCVQMQKQPMIHLPNHIVASTAYVVVPACPLKRISTHGAHVGICVIAQVACRRAHTVALRVSLTVLARHVLPI